jgi:hypothetical protein
MAERPRLETAGVVFALLACVAFVASFALGIGSRRDAPAEPALDPAMTTLDAPAAAGRVEVLNGSERAGMARAVTQRLREAGFDVVYFGNAPGGAIDSTTIFARVPDDAVARAVAEQLAVRRVVLEVDSTLFLEATIVLGKDWR